MRIIVAEDEVVSRMVLEASLRSLGHDAHCFTDGSEALRAYEAQPSEVLILDGFLPGMDGIDVCRAIRALGGQGLATYILMISGRTRDVDMLDALKAGADDFVSKPISIESLDFRLKLAAKRIEDRSMLVECRDRYEAVFRATGDYVVMVDAATSEILDVTDIALELYGFTRGELLGTSMAAIDPMIERHLESARAHAGWIMTRPRRTQTIHHRRSDPPMPVGVVAALGVDRGREVVMLHCRPRLVSRAERIAAVSAYADAETQEAE